MRFLPPLFSLLLVAPAMAHTVDPFSVLSMQGECQNLTAGPEDLIDICAGEIMQVIHRDTRMDISIWMNGESGEFITLSGLTEQGPDAKGFQHIDTVIVGRDGSGYNNLTYKAKGLCTFDNFLVGNAQYRCEAVTKDGSVYNFAFRTEAGEPENLMD